MGLFSAAKLFGMTIRESATDGSDFTNPDADYRRLFLGEDGNLHLKDSSGTVTDIGGGGGDVATDAIWDAAGDLAVGTGANTAAKLTKGSAGGYLAMGNGAVIWNAGTSFPGSKATGDRYFRTDLGLEFYWDGTRWVTTTLYYHNFSGPININANGVFGRLAVVQDFDLYVYKCAVAYLVDTTNDGSKYWTIDLIEFNGATSNTIGSVTSAAESANTFYVENIAVNAAKSGIEQFQVNGTKTSTPGVLVATATLTYRLIGT